MWKGQGRKAAAIKYSCFLGFFKRVLGTCAANRQLVCMCVTREQMRSESNDHKMAVLTTWAVLRVIFYSVAFGSGRGGCWGNGPGPVNRAGRLKWAVMERTPGY